MTQTPHHTSAAPSSSTVLVVGAGGTGMATALQLASRGVRVRLIERNPAPATSSRGIGIHPRTLELLSLHGLADAFVAAGLRQSGLVFHANGEEIARVDFTLAPSRYATIAVPQAHSERLFREALARHGTEVEWGTELLDLTQDEHGVQASLRMADGAVQTAAADWVVGCDGARSTVRGLMGFSFDGESYPENWGLVDCKLDWNLSLDAVRVFVHHDGRQLVVIPLGQGRFRLQIDQRPEALATVPPTLEEMEREATVRSGFAFRLHDLHWASPYRLHRRVADRYRRGRVFIAGDAAHIHSPYGAQGLNTGIQDGLNLGWKLALVANREAHERLLESYERERRPAALRAIEISHSLLRRPREFVASVPPPRLAAMVSGCAASYGDEPRPATVEGSLPPPLRAGDRLPDVDLGALQQQPASLYGRLARGRYTCLRIPAVAEGGAGSAAGRPLGPAWAALVHDVTLGGDDSRAVAEALGLPPGEGATLLVRPDAHLACVGPADAGTTVERYLQGIASGTS